LRRVVSQKFTDASEVLIASIIRAMMEVVSTSETLVNFYEIPEDNHLLVVVARL
jgi:hypothetical protein